MRDLRAIGLCSAGARKFAKKHNIDWSRFLSEGIEDQELLNTNDGMAKWVVGKLNGKVKHTDDRL